MTTSIIDWLEAIWKTNLPSNSKYVAAYLRTYMNAKRDLCWPSIGRIAKETGLSEQTVRTHIKNLEKAEWLIVNRTVGGNQSTTNRYLANIPNSFMDENFVGGKSFDPTPLTVRPLPLQPLQTNIQSNKQKNKQISLEVLEEDLPETCKQLALNYWEKKGIQLDIEEQWLLFCSHHKSKPNKKIKDYGAAWKTWYVNAVKFNKNQTVKKGDAFTRLIDNSWADGLT